MQFNLGDKVQLHSGGPVMTIVQRSHDVFTDEIRYLCCWKCGCEHTNEDWFIESSIQRAGVLQPGGYRNSWGAAHYRRVGNSQAPSFAKLAVKVQCWSCGWLTTTMEGEKKVHCGNCDTVLEFPEGARDDDDDQWECDTE